MYHEKTEGRALPPQQYQVIRTCVMCEETRNAKRQVRIGVDHATRGSVKFLHTRKTPDVEEVRGPSLDPTAQAGSVPDMFLPQAKNLDQYSGTDKARSAHVCALAMCRFTGWTQGAVKCTTFPNSQPTTYKEEFVHLRWVRRSRLTKHSGREFSVTRPRL